MDEADVFRRVDTSTRITGSSSHETISHETAGSCSGRRGDLTAIEAAALPASEPAGFRRVRV